MATLFTVLAAIGLMGLFGIGAAFTLVGLGMGLMFVLAVLTGRWNQG